eukprot:COSAG01_NODE_16351_length_1243_cov_13.838287_2_plen_45_part_01
MKISSRWASRSDRGLVYRSTANPRPLTLKLVRGYAIIGFVAGAVS